MMETTETTEALEHDATWRGDATTDATPSEAETVRRYDRQRRQRLLTLMGATFGGLIGALLVLLGILVAIAGTFGVSEIVELSGTALNALIYVFVVALARRGRVEWAAALFAIGAVVFPNLIIAASTATGAASPFNVAFLVGSIVIVSLAGRPWMVLMAALLASLTTTYMVMAPLPTPTPAERALHEYLALQGSTVLPIMFLIYWGIALLLLAQWRSYQRLLTELADVRTQVERARRLDELKDQFIRNVNHELRTPIMALLGYVDLLMNPENRRSAERVERYVQLAERAGQSLRALLGGILDTRRLGGVAGPLEPTRLDLMRALEDVVPLIPGDGGDGAPVERALRVSMPPGLAVWAEGIKTQQILINLLGNAVKYSAPGAPVDIEARLAQDDESTRRGWFQRATPQPPMVEIVVRDYGLGVPPEQQPLLFQRFVRLPRELESNVMGTGLGLYLSRTMVESMGGSIRVQSSGVPGEGSAFIVRLPAPPESELVPAPATPEAPETPDATPNATPNETLDATLDATLDTPDREPGDSSLRLVAVRPPEAPTNSPANGVAHSVAERQLSDQRS
jgi:signal transduction histidine kinase